MYRGKGIIWYLCLAMILKIPTRAEDCVEKSCETKLNGAEGLEIFRGIKLLTTSKDEVTITVKMFDFLKEREENGRSEKHEGGGGGGKLQPFGNIGTMMMSVPFFMQLLSLPGAIASIKISLLRSIFVAKLAIILMIYNAIKEAATQNKNSKNSVVVHQAQQYHQHYYQAYHQPEDENHGWLGR